jgi:hypothetical protein
MSEDDYVEMTMADLEKLLDDMDTRELQKEAARAISTMPADNDSIYKFNKKARHNSLLWYKAVIVQYISDWGGFPSEVGPGTEVKLVME